jgi:NADH-ubiquinone oxidoreductase chain 5
MTKIGKFFFFFFTKKWFIDSIYNHFVTKKLLYVGYNYSFKLIDRGLLELVGPYGITNLISLISLKISKLQTGYLYHYAFLFFLGLVTFTIINLMHLNTIYLPILTSIIDLRLILIIAIINLIYIIRK